ncbi:hypothetical protein [Coleofasciculus sp. G2-EDA-02]|uniref:hypothetical protein n=1 Tax=Coleofasciculus sp. G2-EDA-02 TaxID=3069529 RepID=UPI0032FCC2C2
MKLKFLPVRLVAKSSPRPFWLQSRLTTQSTSKTCSYFYWAMQDRIKPSLPKRPRNNLEGLRMAGVACEIDRFLSGRTNDLLKLKCLLRDYNKNSVVDWITSRVIPSFQTWEPIKDNRDIDLLLMLERYPMPVI